MNDADHVPDNLEQLRQVVAQHPCVLPVGNRTKNPLCHGNLDSSEQVTLVSLVSLRGIVEYEASEFTFTAWAGTPLKEIEETLLEKQQYLPFDPMLSEAGATIGGTIAAGMSGPGRFRYGGVRDFFLGVQLLNPDGDLVRSGGKVVKNAAGFDLPKFLVGSLGRYAMMVEVSFKVFPLPPTNRTLRMSPGSHQEALQRISAVARSRWEADAIDYRPDSRSLFVRLAGPDGALDGISSEMHRKWPDSERIEAGEANELWRRTKELSWSGFAQPLIAKVPITATCFLELQSRLEDRNDLAVHLSVAAGVAWIALDSPSNVAWLDDQLTSLGLAGLIVIGAVDSPRIGSWPTSNMQRAIKHAMDPHGKFPGV